MKKEVNKTLIGGFIVGAVVLVASAILVVGGGSLFRETNRFVLYFSGSVKGLGLGAPVQLKGVTLGKVTDINLVYDDEKASFLNRVAFEVSEGSITIAGGSSQKGALKRHPTIENAIDTMIEDGLRAKLQTQSFVTGQLLVAFDFYPDTPINLSGLEDDLRELPTLPSGMDELAKTFDALDLQGLVESVKNTAGGIDTLINASDLQALAATANRTLEGYRHLAANLDGHIARMASDVSDTLADLRHLMNTADGQIAPLATGIKDTAAGIKTTVSNLDGRLQPVMATIEAAAAAARDALTQAEAVMTNLTDLSDQDSPLVYRLDETLAETRRTARTLTLLVDYLNRHPEALLQGKKAPEEKE